MHKKLMEREIDYERETVVNKLINYYLYAFKEILSP